jgi:hypothetical protein
MPSYSSNLAPMLQKIIFIYLQHFKLIITLNLFVSISFIYLFWAKGYNHYPLYMLALSLKAVAYGISFGVEKMFFQPRMYHFRNLAMSYRMLFSWLYTADFIFFIAVFLISLACKTYI